MSKKAKKFNLKEEKQKMEMKDGLTLEVVLPQDLAVAFSRFEQIFRPQMTHPNLGDNQPISMNDFIITLILEGAESIQRKFIEAAQAQAAQEIKSTENEDDAN
jgi:hypothetical protein